MVKSWHAPGHARLYTLKIVALLTSIVWLRVSKKRTIYDVLFPGHIVCLKMNFRGFLIFSRRSQVYLNMSANSTSFKSQVVIHFKYLCYSFSSCSDIRLYIWQHRLCSLRQFYYMTVRGPVILVLLSIQSLLLLVTLTAKPYDSEIYKIRLMFFKKIY